MTGRDEWRPNKKQALFLSIPPSIKEAFYGGGAGSGKTDVLLMYGIVHHWHENARFKQVFMRRTFPELKKEVVPRSKEIYSKFGARFNQTDMAWTFPSGAMVFLGHCENENDVHSYDSMEISLYTPDELTSYTEYIYTYITFERNRAPKNSGLPSITRSTGMPGNIGHTFVKKRFVDPYKEGGKVIVGRGGNKRIFIHATQADNKDHIDPTYEQSLRGRPEAEMRAKLFGDWDAYLGQVFDEFRDRHYAEEPDNALHVIESFPIPDWWPKIVVGDWGFAAMTWIGFFAISPTGRVYLYRELTWVKTKIEDWVPVVKYFVDKESPKVVKFCKSAGQDRGQEHTIQQQIESALGRPIELSNNTVGSRVAGKMLLHEYLRWRAKPTVPVEELPAYNEEYASWLLRNKGLIDYKAYLSLFDPPQEETNIPKLQIFCCGSENHEGHEHCCPEVINAIKACSYDKTRIEDVAEFNGDDPYDGLRYGIDAAEHYFEESASEFEKVQRQEALIKRVESSQNWTAFYMQMRHMESEDTPHMIRRFHRR